MHPLGRCAGPLLATASVMLAACIVDETGTGPDPADAVASVTVSPAAVSMDIGETVQLSAAVLTGRGDPVSPTVSWSSSAPAVAGVSSDGLLIGIGTGSATITAMSEGKSGLSTVTVAILGDDQFVLIPPGSFLMGSTTGDADERPVHLVNITQPFYMQKTEVRQGVWREVMGWEPSSFGFCGDDCPVAGVSWDEVQEFVSRLNAAQMGRYYRLPTEAEWEYAARAGTTGGYGGPGTLDDMGWYAGNSGSRVHPVAQKLPNAWGLYDMHGNVVEWVLDWNSSSYYSVSPMDDPMGPATGSSRVVRGGSWFHGANFARSAFRGAVNPSSGFFFSGFRLVSHR